MPVRIGTVGTLALATALAATGCFSPPEVDEGLYCGPENDRSCPDGQTCAADERCHWVGSDLCDTPLPCPASDGDENAVCGQLFDISTRAEIRESGATGTVCRVGDEPAPCWLSLTFYDRDDFEAKPDAPTPLSVSTLTVDDCGRFAALGIEHATSDYVTIVTDDASADDYVATARTLYLDPGAVERGTFTVATPRAIDQNWTTTAGDPFDGQTFSEVGAHLAFFQHQNEPAEGVVATVGSDSRPAYDWYFSDTNAEERTTIDPTADSTSVNGAALVINGGYAPHSGEGGSLPDDCVWSSDDHLTVPGLISYGEYFSRLEDDSRDCP